MKEALAIISKTEEGTQTVFFDQEVLECARLNKRTKERINLHRQDREEKAQYRKEMEHIANRVVVDAACATGFVWAGVERLIHPGIWLPCAFICLGAACVRLGLWFGKVKK